MDDRQLAAMSYRKKIHNFLSATCSPIINQDRREFMWAGVKTYETDDDFVVVNCSKSKFRNIEDLEMLKELYEAIIKDRVMSKWSNVLKILKAEWRTENR